MPERTSTSGWARVAFGDVVRLSRERSADLAREGRERYVGLEHIDPNDLAIRRWGRVEEGTTFTSAFRGGQTLFGKRRAYQRKVAVPDFDGVCSSDIYVLEPQTAKLLPELLPYLCQSEGFFTHAVGTSAGSLSPRTNWDSLAKFEFVLPPIDDQRRIAAALGAYDLTISALTNARERAAHLRASLLAQFFPDTGEGHHASLQQLIEDGDLLFQTGPFGTVLAASAFRPRGWPVVNPTHIRDGQIVHIGGPYVDDETARRLARYRMRADDVLLARKGEVDKACVATEQHDGWIVGSDCILLRSQSPKLNGRHLLLFLQSPGTGRVLRSLAHGTVMPGLNEKMLARLQIPIGEAQRQQQEVALASEVDSLRSAFGARARSARQLRNAFLSHVFGDRATR
ncbi:MAG: restriction endonuclease subunit S [Acidobacteriota bacterium]